MTPYQIAQIQADAERLERQKIANSFRLMATQIESKRPNVAEILRDMAEGVERGDYSK